MLTVKIQSSNGMENIIEAKKVQYSAKYNSLSFEEGTIDIPPESVAYVMNADGKTIGRYENRTTA